MTTTSFPPRDNGREACPIVVEPVDTDWQTLIDAWLATQHRAAA